MAPFVPSNSRRPPRTPTGSSEKWCKCAIFGTEFDVTIFKYQNFCFLSDSFWRVFFLLPRTTHITPLMAVDIDNEIISAYLVNHLNTRKPKERNDIIYDHLKTKCIELPREKLAKRVYTLISTNKISNQTWLDIEPTTATQPEPLWESNREDDSPVYAQCRICRAEGDGFLSLPCGHLVHSECWQRLVSTTSKRQCKVCNKKSKPTEERPLFL